jgi:hypothetical protein
MRLRLRLRLRFQLLLGIPPRKMLPEFYIFVHYFQQESYFLLAPGIGRDHCWVHGIACLEKMPAFYDYSIWCGLRSLCMHRRTRGERRTIVPKFAYHYATKLYMIFRRYFERVIDSDLPSAVILVQW